MPPGKMLSKQEKAKQAKEAATKKTAAAAKTEAPAKWTLDATKLKKKELTEASETALKQFMNGVKAGKHPKVAASGSDTKYTLLGGSKNQYEIRLNGGDRATFLVDDTKHVVTMLQAGGHT